MNAVLQMLYSMSDFRQFFTNLDISKVTPDRFKSDGAKYVPFIKELAKLFETFQSKAGKVVDTDTLKMDGQSVYTILLSGSKEFKRGISADAEELLRLSIFDPIIEFIDAKDIYDLITFSTETTITCDNGRIRYDSPGVPEPPKHEIYNIFPLSLENGNTIQTLLNSVSTPEQIINKIGTDDNEVLGCGNNPKEKGPAKKIMVLKAGIKLKYALIHLKRFKQNADGTNTKIDTSITPDKDITIDGKQFQLKGIICHSGNTGGGHYWYILCKNGDPIIELNDANARPLTNPTAQLRRLETLGYIYLYERVKVIGGSRITRKQSRSRVRAPTRKSSQSSRKTSVSGTA
jgi:ubiquitin C-terminal hydrolase